MRNRKWFFVFAILAGLLILAACRPITAEPPAATAEPAAATEAPTAETPATEEAAAAVGVYVPIPEADCQTLQTDAEAALGVPFAMSTAPFTDYVSGEGGTGCLLTATGTGAQFSDPMTVIDKLKAEFVGWEENMNYAAGGPTGAAIGMTRDQGLMLVSANWQPGPAVSCPADQPISACAVPPEHQIYTITVEAAMK
jgi:hypothetical protein